MIDLLAQFKQDEERIRQGGGPKAIEAQHKKGRLTARERIGRLEQVLFDLLTKSNQPMLEFWIPCLPDLPDFEVHKTHREHVVSQKGKLIFAVRVVRLESIPQEFDILLLR